jgi:GNAT superfamily N-acetyltransferase
MHKQTQRTMLDDNWVTIRPIRQTDTVLEGDFIRNLSMATKHFRFFGGVKELPAAEIERLCTVDGRASMAFVATVQRDGQEVEIGVCRYAAAAQGDVREMAVTIADEWQHKGLGKLLVQHLIAYAREHGVRQLYSQDLADDPVMRELAQEIGMSEKRDPGNGCQVIHSLAL